MAYSLKLKRGESVIYLILWSVVLLMPVFIANDAGLNWERIQREWIRFLPFLILFLIHNYWLFPQFFVQNKRMFYVALVIVFIVAVGFLAELAGNLFHFQGPKDFGDPALRDLPPMGRGPRKPEPWHRFFMDNFLVSILVVGFNAAIKLTIIWQAEEEKNKELEKEKLKTELAFLKNQVSPHFFMNTLNNIHALIDIDAEDAKESVIKLSKLMRYLLYDSETGQTTLAKEIEFIKSYVDLMKLRFTNDVRVNLSFPEQIPQIQIPPMLFISFIENAFKHGISYQKESFVEIYLNFNTEDLFFRVRNSLFKNENLLNEPGGIGLENVKKRLDIIYKGKYTLQKTEQDNAFEINIKVPLNG